MNDEQIEAIYQHACEGAAESVGSTRADWQQVVDAIRELRRQLAVYEADAVHTCGDACQRPTCVLRRERDALAAELKALREQEPQCYYVGLIDGQHVVNMLDGSLVPAIGTAYYKHAAPVPAQEDVARDAARYRILREIRWNDAPMDCPSGARLDAMLDAMLAAKGEGNE